MPSHTEASDQQSVKTKKLLKSLIETVQATTEEKDKLGLLSGLAGDLLFLWAASQYDHELVDEAIFNKKFEFIQEHLSQTYSGLTFSNGLAGIGWFLEYLNQEQGESYDPELCEDIDEILLKVVSTQKWHGEIELVLGLVGLSIYGARRQQKSDQSQFFALLISHFEHLSTQMKNNTISWAQPKNSVFRMDKKDVTTPEYNLGLAHGVPGIIAALLPALKTPSLFRRTKTLIIQSCDWLLGQQLDNDEAYSYFSSTNNSKHSSRLGWCYGDLTIALTLHRVGKVFNLPSYLEKAKEMSLHCALRDEVDGMVYDAGICHGSAGLSLIFKILYKEIQEEELLEASERWLNFTLELYEKKGIEGLHMLSGYDNTYRESTGYLEGYSGIGLCLLASLSEEHGWTDSLLLS